MKIFIALFSMLPITAVMAEEVDLSILGINSLSRFDYSWDVQVDENCDYTFTSEFMHDPTLPIGDLEVDCQPTLVADDGKLFLEGRFHWLQYPPYIKDATGLDHLSLDYNACGHPTGGFLVSHYDLHFYRITPEFRVTQMHCNVKFGTPLCLPDEQDTPEGEAFFLLERSPTSDLLVNMPAKFENLPYDGIINMGMHSFDVDAAPEVPSEWDDPTFVLLTYNATIIAVEPMLPFKYIIGDEYHYKREDLTYVEQNIPTLPYMYSTEFQNGTNLVTVILKGKSDTCKEDFEAAEAAYLNGGKDSASLVTFYWSALVMSIAALTIFA